MPNDRLLFRFIIPAVGVPKGRARSRLVTTKAKAGKPAKTFASHYTPAATRDFEAMVKDFAAQAIGGPGADPLTCPVDLLVEFRFKIPDSWPKWQRELAALGLVHHTRKPDCSNLIKAIEDACNGVLFKDDGQVVGSITDKTYTTGAECIEVFGFRRSGISCQATRAEAIAALEGYDPGLRMDHLPIGRRLRTLKLVAP